MLKPTFNLPFDMLNLILEYYGRIKYLHKEHIYINIISKNDYKYNIIETKINNKKKFNKYFKYLKQWIKLLYLYTL